MKKFWCAISLVVLLASACAAAEVMDGVWNLKFGMSREVVGPIMIEKNGAVRVTEYTYQPGYSEAVYLVNFFGREGTMLLRYSKRGLFLARFSFDRKEDKNPTPPPPAPEEPAPEGPKVIDGRASVPEDVRPEANRPPAPDVRRPLPQSRNFLHLKTMLTKKYGISSSEIKVEDVVLGYEWKFPRGNSIVLFEDRFTPGNQAVLTYEASSLR